jgi:AcrR family transcriptional regulator
LFGYHQFVAKPKAASCARAYSLGRRQELSDRKRAKILATARAQLESNGLLNFSLESIAQQSGVTRQTVYNLFGTRAGLLEALFDQLALPGGMERMRSVMRETNAESALTSFVDVFCGFWGKDRLLIRRIHGIAATDPEFGAAVEARNRRRQGAAARIVGLLDATHGKRTGQEHSQRATTLWALTSFEFFDALAEGCGSIAGAAQLVQSLVKGALFYASGQSARQALKGRR